MKYLATVNEKTFEIEVNQDGRVMVNGQERAIDFKNISETLFSVLINNASFEAFVEQHDGRYQVLISGELYEVEVLDERQQRLARSSAGFSVAQGEFSVRSPMPGLIVAVRVSEGQVVNQGDALCVLESMKMENDIKAPRAGTINRVHVSAGERVEQNKVLITLA